MMRIIFSVLAMTFIGCAHENKQNDISNSDRLAKLNRATRMREKKEEDKRLDDLLRSARLNKQKSLSKLYPMPPVMSEENLYTFVIQAYQSRDMNGLEYYSNQFTERYPKSVFADNAIYLNGHLKLMMGLPGEALREFEKTIGAYPAGNKRVAAMFGKAVAYKKLELKDYAQKIFTEIQEKYPGSPEYYKIELEQKL